MSTIKWAAVLVWLVVASNNAPATVTVTTDNFGSGGNAFTIDFVDIGNAGNAADYPMFGRVYGAVDYTYRIGVTEVPQNWVTKAGTPQSGVPFGATQPATIITWYQAAAFVNYLNTSTGHQAAYNLNEGASSQTLWSSVDAWQAGGENLYRHKDAYYFLPSEDEWYKAAYHKNDGVTANFWNYPTASNAIPTAVASGTGAGTAVYNNQAGPSLVTLAGGLSAYGTMGQGGNVYEWAESAHDGVNDSSSEDRLIRGGVYYDAEGSMTPVWRSPLDPLISIQPVGFRVASAVPEPSRALLMLGGLGALMLRRRR